MMSESASQHQQDCLVIGGRGFLGRAIADEGERLGYHVVRIGRKDYDDAVGKSWDLVINANGNSKKYLARKAPLEDFYQSVESVARSLVDFPTERYVFLSSVDVYADCSTPATGVQSPDTSAKKVADRVASSAFARRCLVAARM